MSQPKIPDPAKLFLSAIYRDQSAIAAGLEALTRRYGPVDHATRELPFTSTHYYEEEMGEPLYRRFFTLGPLIPHELLVEIKLATNALEAEQSREGRRRLNLDPGIITVYNLILATAKPAGHRPYLGQGIYADVTLTFERGSFQALPWTYPDYAGAEMIAFLNRMREDYKFSLKQWREEVKRAYVVGQG